MTGWLKTLLIGAASTAAVAAVAATAYFGIPYVRHMLGAPPPAGPSSPQSPDFTKTAYKLDASGNPVLDSNGDPVPVSGPVHPGDKIQYVLTYKPPAPGPSGPVTITDTLSANQTYLNPSIAAPGWTYTSPPFGTAAQTGNPVDNQTVFSSPGIAPGGSAVLTIPAISGSVGAPGGGGDGYEPVPVVTSTGTKVFGVNHHQAINGLIMCWMGATLAKCSPTYPKRVSTSPEQRGTPDFPHAVVYNKKVYFPVGRYNEVAKTTLEFGIGCWDAETDSECPFVSLPGQPSLNMAGNTTPYLGTNLDGYVAGVRADPQNPSHLLMYANGNIYCVDIAVLGAPACAGWAPSPISPTSVAGRSGDMFVEESGTRLFFSNTVPSVHCVNLSDGSLCAGWPSAGVNGGATGATHLGPGLDSSGAMNAICLSQTFGASNFRCFSTANGTSVASWPAALATSGIFAAYHIPGTARVLYPPYTNNPIPKCYDFSTSAYCTPFTPYWSSNNNWTDSGGTSHGSVRDYGYASDPSAPQDCIYGLGDGGLLVRFAADGTPATKACLPKTYTTTYNLKDQFCAHQPREATWTTVDIVGRPSELVGGTITIKDGSGTVLQTIAVTAANSYTVNLPATGANGSVTVEFAPNYGSNNAPAADYQIKLNYTADVDPQICYSVVIKDCDDTLSQGPVTNKAVYADSVGTREADLDLGKVTGGHCGPPPCLDLASAITFNPDGTGTLTLTGGGPSGFSSHVVSVHSNTPGVTVTPPSRVFSSGAINGTWNLTGLTPGLTIEFQVDAVDPGAGTNGGDKCCSSTITVTVPPQEHGPRNDLAIRKTGVSEGQGPANGSGYIYTLSVTNVGAPVNGQNTIVVTDVVPAGLSFASANGTDWTCVGPFPIAAGGTLTCTYTGTAPLATGQLLPPITVISTNPAHGTQLPAVTNCADVAFATGSGLIDTDPSNNRSCTGDDPHAATGSLTVIKVVETDSLDYSGVTFQVQTSCLPITGPAATSTLNLNAADNYTQTLTNLPAGAVCTVTELPPPLPSTFPANCHWVTSYPTGQQATVGAGVVEIRVVNRVSCTQAPPKCDPKTTRSGGGECICRYPGMTHRQGVENACSCPTGTSLVAGKGCLTPRQACTEPGHWNGLTCTTCERGATWNSRTNRCERKLICEPTSTRSEDGECLCRYDGMTQTSPTRCICAQGSTLVPGRGCVLTCRDPMIPNRRGTACVCPDGMKTRNGKCEEGRSPIDDIFGHFGGSVGGGVRGGGGEGDRHRDRGH